MILINNINNNNINNNNIIIDNTTNTISYTVIQYAEEVATHSPNREVDGDSHTL